MSSNGHSDVHPAVHADVHTDVRVDDQPAVQRRRSILDKVRVDGRVQVTQIARTLQVSAETVRRDLHVLENQGLLRRTHGGAHPIDGAAFETGLADRGRQYTAEKGRIAVAATNVLEPFETIFLDEGSTAMAVADRLVATTTRPLTIVTHSISVAAVMATRHATDVVMLGGRLRSTSMATVGSAATAMLAELTVDVAVLSASGISLSFGLSTADPETADLKRVALKAARASIFVGDHTKFGVTSFCRYGGLTDFTAIITDSGLASSVAARYKAVGPRLIRA